MAHALEVFYDPRSYMWLGMVLLLNIGAAVSNAFGPTLIATFGDDTFVSFPLSTPVRS